MANTTQESPHRKLTALNVDLNLLVVLQALLEEKSVTHAAKRVCLSQSATSNALKRLRDVFDDPLLIRWSNRMGLTPKGMELLEPVNLAIDAINRVLGDPPPFDPKETITTVRICASDYTGISLLPKLEKHLQTQAPGITLDISPLREPEALRRLEREDVSLVIGNFPDPPSMFNHVELFHEKFVCILRKNHPLINQCVGDQLTLDQFVSYPHAVISREGGDSDLVDEVLYKNGLERTIGIRVPHFLVAPSIAANSDMIVVEARRVATLFEDSFPHHVLELPPEYAAHAELPIHMLWHQRTHDNPVLSWLRKLIEKVSNSL